MAGGYNSTHNLGICFPWCRASNSSAVPWFSFLRKQVLRPKFECKYLFGSTKNMNWEVGEWHREGCMIKSATKMVTGKISINPLGELWESVLPLQRNKTARIFKYQLSCLSLVPTCYSLSLSPSLPPSTPLWQLMCCHLKRPTRILS